MKYTILINQRAIVEINDKLSAAMQLDIKDATILAWLMDFHNEPRSKKLLLNEVVYFWVAYGLIIKENPLLGIDNKQVIKRRIDKLISVGLVDKHLETSEGNRTYFTINQKAFDIIRYVSTLSTQKLIPINSIVDTLSTEKLNNKTIIDKTINKSENALDFLKFENEIMYERLMMLYKKKTQNFEKLVKLFNAKFEVEELPYKTKVIYHRFIGFADNFIEIDRKQNPEQTPHVYLRKIS